MDRARMFSDSPYAGPQAAGAPHDEVHLHTFAAGLVEHLDELGIHQGVHLQHHAGGPAVAGMADLPRDAVLQGLLHVLGRQQDPVEAGRPRVAREHVEEVGQVLAELRSRSQQADVGVHRRLVRSL